MWRHLEAVRFGRSVGRMDGGGRVTSLAIHRTALLNLIRMPVK